MDFKYLAELAGQLPAAQEDLTKTELDLVLHNSIEATYAYKLALATLIALEVDIDLLSMLLMVPEQITFPCPRS